VAPPRGRGGPNQPSRSGVRIDFDLEFEFRPSMGISAARVDKLGLNIKSFREPLKRSIQQVMAPSFRKNFDVGGRPKWEPLADYTIEKRDSATPVLIRSGLLRRTIGQFNIWTVDTQKAAILDLPQKIWYGKIHQGGYGSRTRRGSTGRTKGQIKAAHIPARPFVLIQTEDYAGIDRVFERWLYERMIGSGAFTGRGGRR
jgi:phage gpG-like protein